MWGYLGLYKSMNLCCPLRSLEGMIRLDAKLLRQNRFVAKVLPLRREWRLLIFWEEACGDPWYGGQYLLRYVLALIVAVSFFRLFMFCFLFGVDCWQPNNKFQKMQINGWSVDFSDQKREPKRDPVSVISPASWQQTSLYQLSGLQVWLTMHCNPHIEEVFLCDSYLVNLMEDPA